MIRVQLAPYDCAPVPSFFQMNTLPSYDALARIVPNDGCAHATCHTGPSWPTSVSPALTAVPFCTSNTLMVRSDEQVASLLP